MTGLVPAQSPFPQLSDLLRSLQTRFSFSYLAKCALVFLISALAFVIANPASATTPENTAKLEKQRALYKQAKKALKQNKIKEFSKLEKKLKGYSLYPYLRYDILSRNLSKLKQSEFDQFAKDFADTPLPRHLQIRWIKYLAKRKQWNKLLANFPESTSSATLNCQRGLALLHTKQKDKAFEAAEKLWVAAKSQPKTCDPLFAEWIKQGGVTEDLAWERFWLATLNRQTTLSNYLTRFIKTPSRNKQAKQAIRLLRNPKLLAKESLDPSIENHSELIALLINRLVRKDADLAIQLWEKYQQDLRLTDNQKANLVRRVGLYLLKSYHKDSEDMLSKLDPNFNDEKLIEWRLRYQLTKKDWQAIRQLIEKLPADIQQKDRWQYWLARVQLSEGNKDSAVHLLNEIAHNRNFYGFLAAQKLGIEYQLNHTPKPTNPLTLKALASMPALQRARELHYHQDMTNARIEWWRAGRNFTKDQHYHAGLLAQSWGWISQGITGAINSRHWDDLTLRFPAPYKQKISAKASKFKIDDQWVYAVARQESAFKSDVRSPAGAVGLMQLMPRTAKQTAKSIKLPYKGSYQLVNPDTNITLGSAYLSQMYKKHQNNRIYATAAYNAGPHRVSQWLKERGDLPIDIWVETIPFDETRQYVQNVLSYAVIYSDKLGKPLEFMTPEERKSLVSLTP